MSGNLIGELILWLIVAIIVIVIAVYIVNWLYHRSSKEVSFVRTGFLGERVVINGGAFVLPFVHDTTPVNMNVLPMGITRAKQDAVITRDRMRVDIEADFYVRVQSTREAVAIAAATLGRRTMEPEQLSALLSGKFVSVIRSVASSTACHLGFAICGMFRNSFTIPCTRRNIPGRTLFRRYAALKKTSASLSVPSSSVASNRARGLAPR